MTAPRPEAVEVAQAILCMARTDAAFTDAARLIDAAITAARADERERACKAVCERCRDGVPVARSEGVIYHNTQSGPRMCRAFAIRAMEGR